MVPQFRRHGRQRELQGVSTERLADQNDGAHTKLLHGATGEDRDHILHLLWRAAVAEIGQRVEAQHRHAIGSEPRGDFWPHAGVEAHVSRQEGDGIIGLWRVRGRWNQCERIAGEITEIAQIPPAPDAEDQQHRSRPAQQRFHPPISHDTAPSGSRSSPGLGGRLALSTLRFISAPLSGIFGRCLADHPIAQRGKGCARFGTSGS